MFKEILNEIIVSFKYQANAGYCHCCRSATKFLIKNSWLRDGYRCKKCNSIPRQRHLQYILDTHIHGWEYLLIHESSPGNRFISNYAKSYTSSQYLPDTPFGQCSPKGIRSENLESLTFPSECFDIFITQDVFEHILNPEQAAKEIARVLKPGGIHIFTAPKYKRLSKSFRRAAKAESGEIEFLHPPEYHGNPVGDGRSLVTWYYGDDFETLLTKWSGLPTTTYVTRDRNLGIDAEFIEVFLTRKTI